jgi:cation diffusion facilitator CzcD-associated flavoprotein CzcO
MSHHFDAIVIGAGQAGIPLRMLLTAKNVGLLFLVMNSRVW